MTKIIKFFLEEYPKKYISKVRKRGRELGYRITKKGLFYGNEKVQINDLNELFSILDLPLINNYDSYMFGGVDGKEERKVGKLKLLPEFKEALERITQGQRVKYMPPEEKGPPEAPPLALPPLAPPLGVPLAPPLLAPAMAPQLIQNGPLTKLNLYKQLQIYKDTLEQIKSICPLLKRVYVRKYAIDNKPYTRQMKRSAKMIEKANQMIEEMRARALLR